MDHIKKNVVLIAFTVLASGAFTVAIADEKIEGKVVATNLTLCHPRPTGGGCSGTLTVETKAGGTVQPVVINVIADTIIRKGKSYLFLPATQDSTVVVSYITDKGKKVAKSIEVVGSAR